jgi:tetratricopeptide (TPR) repeat protein
MMTKIDFSKRAMVLLVAALALLALPLSAQVAEGDRQYAGRAAGAHGAHAQAGPIDAAIAAYQRAIAQNQNDIDAHGKLLRAYRFKGAYAATSNDEKKKIYAAAKTAGEQALAAVGRQLTAKGIKPDAPEKKVADAARSIPGASSVYLFDAVNWGEWALAYGKMAAARQGAADRIRREATIAHLIDPALEAAAPSRVLGRLHDQTPHIPFITGWASSKEAVKFLEESLKHDPTNKITLVFLAEALVSNKSAAKPRALQLLRTTISAPIHPEYPVEDAAAIDDAKALLKKWGV